MPNCRDSLRVRSVLDAWVYGPGAPMGERARALDLSRSGVGLAVVSEGESVPPFPLGEMVRVSLLDRVGDVPLARQWTGRIVNARHGEEGSRLGVAFDWPEGRGARLRSEVEGRGRSAWPIEVGEVAPTAIGIDPLALAVALSALGVDQWSKSWAMSLGRGLGGMPGVASGVLAIAPTENPGALAGMAGGSWVTGPLCAFGGLALAGAVISGSGGRRSSAQAVGAGLLAAGALGNAFDRLALGYVRDFLASGALPNWAFNLADVFLVAGAIALAASRRNGDEVV